MRKDFNIGFLLKVLLPFLCSAYLANAAELTKSQSEELDSLYYIAFDHTGVDIEEAQVKANLYLARARAYNDSLSIAYAMDVKGLACFYADKVDSAFYYANRSIDLFRRLAVDSFGLSTAIYNRSVYHDYLGSYKTALQDLHLSREIDINQGDKAGSDVFYFYSLSDIIYSQGYKELALRYLYRAWRVQRESGNWFSYLEPDMLADYAWTYLELELYELAEHFAKLAYQRSINQDLLTVRSSALQVLSKVASVRGDNELALNYARSAIRYDQQYGDGFTIIYSKSFLASRLKDAGKIKEAQELFKEVAASYEQYPNPVMRIDVSKDLYEFHKSQGNDALALRFLEVMNREQEKVNRVDGQAAMRQFDEELANRQRELIKAKAQLQEEELNRQNTLLTALAVIIGILMLFFVVFLVGYQKIKKAKVELEERNREIHNQSEMIAKASQELKEQNISLEKLNRSKDRLFSVLAHDLRQPFNQILSVIDLMEDSKLEGEDRHELLKELRGSVNNTSDLVSNVLLWSKAQFAGVTLNPVNFSLVNAVKRSLLHYSISLEKKQIHLDLDIPDRLGIIFDPDHFASVFRNILSNALKFSPQGETIKIWASEAEDSIDLYIKDNGVGMDQEQKDRLMVADNNTSLPGTLNESGTGIGMVIVSEFMRENKASYEIETALDAGTTFILHLPKGKAIVYERKQAFNVLKDYQ